MKSIRFFKGMLEIRAAVNELEEKEQITENSATEIKKHLKRLFNLISRRYRLTAALGAILVVVLFYFFPYFQSKMPPDTVPQELAGLLFFVGFILTLVVLFVFSFFLMKIPFHHPMKKATANLGKAVQMQEPLRSIFVEHFGPKPKSGQADRTEMSFPEKEG